jgi:hypothetical protein
MKENKVPFEPWMVQLAMRANKDRGLVCTLLYDDRHHGDILVLNTLSANGLCELQVRRGQKGGVLYLLADNRNTLEHFNEVTESLYREVPRTKNSRRKFLHRVEWMGNKLARTYEVRAKEYPLAELGKLQKVLEGAEMMVGIKTTFRQRADPEDERLRKSEVGGKVARQMRRYPLAFGAKITTLHGARAALFDPQKRRFELRGDASAALTDVLPEPTTNDLARFNISLFPGEGKPGHEDWVLQKKPEVESSNAVAWIEVGTYTTCEACDLPDLTFCDVPDCGF